MTMATWISLHHGDIGRFPAYRQAPINKNHHRYDPRGNIDLGGQLQGVHRERRRYLTMVGCLGFSYYVKSVAFSRCRSVASSWFEFHRWGWG